MAPEYPGLRGCRVLVVEDELLVAMDLETVLIDHGCEVVDCAASVSAALTSIAMHKPGLVILDRNLDGERTSAVADELNRQCIPFVVVTGYVHGVGDDPAMARAPCVQKPWRPNELLSHVCQVLGNECRPVPAPRR